MENERPDGAHGHVELSTLDALERAMPDGDGWLTHDERTRLATIGAAPRRRQFLAGHWLARRLAGQALGADPDRIGMDRDPRGVPRLWLDDGLSPWRVSLTHSDDQVACAVAPVAVGIDLEVPRRARDLAALARFTFSPEENDRLAAAAAGDRVAEFYRLWALKEARGKRCGEGVLPRAARCTGTAACAGPDAEAVTWTLGDVTLAVASAGAVRFRAVGLPPGARIAYWRFTGAGSGDG